MTLTKHQRYTRKKQMQSKKDFKRAKSVTGNSSVYSTKKKVSAKVSPEAYERLKERAIEERLTQSRLLERMIIQGLPRYASGTGEMGTNRYYWHKPEEAKTRRRKGTSGTKQLNLWIGSTAWRKLDIHADTIGESKARILDRLLKTYRFLTPQGKERNRLYAEKLAKKYPK